MVTKWRIAATSADRIRQVHVIWVHPIRKSPIGILHVHIFVESAQILALIVGKGITRILNEIIETSEWLLTHLSIGFVTTHN